MGKHCEQRLISLGWVCALILALAVPAYAVDGVIEINQARALAGGVTLGDTTPGFPVTISQPGSYRLTGNLTVPNENTTAIQITAENVTIDLNGFAILGPTVCTYTGVGAIPVTCMPAGTGRGIDGTAAGLAVLNGTVRGMGAAGIFFQGGSRAEGVHVVSNGSSGIGGNYGSSNLITHNIAELNGEAGIQAGGGATVSQNVAAYNGIRGIDAGGGECTIIGNTATLNGSEGIYSNNLSTITNNTTVANKGDGIFTGGGSLVQGNQSSANGGRGLAFSFGGGAAGYTHNVFASNTGGSVGGGAPVSLGQNLCNGVVC
ncbi:MAG: right-handed parallel beta-helix repeat-containing protein [Deltaproteobacteria bacterium]|nr:right-handed parallel beta-helix repeat-containing protein [Deltaproteobacteria bacterium]MBI3391435.1 right-handed parallel beta-helix repeat-containing protein [Deltaproteobacteria bacterium]